jgi:acetyl-CoA carboxylase carboxyl transferase subunit beta
MPLFSKPKYSTVTVKKRDIPRGLWTKDPITGDLIYNKELEQNLLVAPKSGYHFPMDGFTRMNSLLDEGTFEEWDADISSVDPLSFVDSKPYIERLETYRNKTKLTDAVICGSGKLHDIPVEVSVMDFRFIGASMGSVVGEKITRSVERATERGTPCIIICASGGARMQEGILSLMQMAKTSAALARQAKAKLPYISVLTNPTYAGVMASFASLGDLIIAEPGALIGFAGARVIKETTNEELPKGFQTAEFLLEHGLVDQIVHRHELKDRMKSFLSIMWSADRSI